MQNFAENLAQNLKKDFLAALTAFHKFWDVVPGPIKVILYTVSSGEIALFITQLKATTVTSPYLVLVLASVVNILEYLVQWLTKKMVL